MLSVSFYGGPVAGAKQFSGALGRQKDYAQYMERYVVLVPGGEHASEEPRDLGDGLFLYALPGYGYGAFFLSVLKRIRALHKEHRFDVILVDNPHIAGVLGVILKHILKLPLVVNTMADMPYNKWYKRERLSNRIKHLMILFMLRNLDLLRVSTKAEIERLTEKGYDMSKVFQMPFYIDADSFSEKFDAASTPDKKDKMALFVGRLGPQKDIDTLLKAWMHTLKRHRDAELVLVGGGPDDERLKTLARNLGVDKSVTFTGAIPYDEVAAHFKRARLFAISSLYEGTCMVLHEAAVARLPIVSTDYAGAKDYVRDGKEGYLVPVRDDKALGGRIADIFDNPEKATKMGEASHERLELFSRERALEHWDRFCKRMAGIEVI